MEHFQRMTLPDEGLPGSTIEGETALDKPHHYQQISRQWTVMPQSNLWRPPTDVFEFADRVVVLVEIAGMRDEAFSVVLQDRRLAISGRRDRPALDGVAYHQVDVHYGRFFAEVVLPFPVERGQVSATYNDGFLRVELPRARRQHIHIVDVDMDQDTEQK